MIQPPPRRPGELGVHSLDHFSLLVPDAADAEKFYGLFGLNTKTRRRAASLRSTPRVSPPLGHGGRGPRKKPNYVSFGTFEDDTCPELQESSRPIGVRCLIP
jgi:hypothetical protein